MPLAALFIGGVLPAQLGSLIRKRAGYMKATSRKRQATSCLTIVIRYYKIDLERNNMDTAQLKRIADAIEEILRLVKKDQEDSAARQRQWDKEKK